MLKEYIGTGKTIEEATAVAKAGLNAPLSADVKVEVITMPQKKFLGIFGGANAEVKASYDDGVKEKKQNKKQPKNNQKKEAPKKEKPAKTASVSVSEAPEEKKDAPKSVDLEYAKAYFGDILKGLNIDDAKINAVYENGVVTMDLECEDFGIVIGRRGETLDSIQYLISLAMKKKSNGYVRVSINVGDYREKRNETLRALAKKHASYVQRTGRRYTFEPMNPYERRIIHTAIQEIEGVESRSIGYNQDRRVVLEPTGGVKRSDRGRRNSKPAVQQVSDREPKADRADLPKFGKIEVNKD
ncbi:MAG: KH domain-containing protein [Eubacterium sp.]|nr:KH domain-containing protein [Eubacterium sp.]